ncbi:TVP38/TMEM64 family protein [Methyloligella solikamskensis]|uniref:TVP38/TMEM64 family membrane protein n=1 Tax=Methyloligella solikamskensis TaxID=1177756 RepID=A0ABW3JCZ4_9HYPH
MISEPTDKPKAVRGVADRSLAALRRFWPLAALVVAGVVVYLMGWHRYLSFRELAESRDALHEMLSSHMVLTLALYIVIYAASVALSVPGGAILTLAGGFLFGWLWGGLAAVVAATLGAVIVYLATRSAFRNLLLDKLEDTPLDRFRKGFSEDAFNYLLFLRVVPVFPFWLVNLVPGPLGVSFRTYTLATFIGIIPGTFAFSIAGAGLDSVIAAQSARCAAEGSPKGECLHFDASAIFTPELIAGFIALGVLALVPIVVKRYRKKPY